MNRNVFLLWQGQLVSQLGSQAFSIAMLYWLMEQTGSSALMGTVLAVSLLPSIILGPFGGVFADRFSRKKIIITTDLIRGFSVLVLALLMILASQETTLIISTFFVASIFNGLARAFFQPAVDALLPDLIEAKNLQKTIALFGSTTQAAMVLGQALGGILYRIFGAPILMFFDAASYLFSACSEIFIDAPPTAKPQKSNSFKQVLTSLLGDMKFGISYVKQNRGLLKTMCFVSSVNFFSAPAMLFLPFYVKEHIQQEAQWYGFMLAAMALGSIAGYTVSQSLKIEAPKRAKVMCLSLFISSCCLVGLAASSLVVISISLFATSGFFLGVFNLQAMTIFQSTIPTQIRGRVLSLLMTISSGLLPLGLLLGGLVGELSGNNTVLIYAGSGLAMAITSLFFVVDTDTKTFLSSEIAA